MSSPVRTFRHPLKTSKKQNKSKSFSALHNTTRSQPLTIQMAASSSTEESFCFMSDTIVVSEDGQLKWTDGKKVTAPRYHGVSRSLVRNHGRDVPYSAFRLNMGVIKALRIRAFEDESGSGSAYITPCPEVHTFLKAVKKEFMRSVEAAQQKLPCTMPYSSKNDAELRITLKSRKSVSPTRIVSVGIKRPVISKWNEMFGYKAALRVYVTAWTTTDAAGVASSHTIKLTAETITLTEAPENPKTQKRDAELSLEQLSALAVKMAGAPRAAPGAPGRQNLKRRKTAAKRARSDSLEKLISKE